MNGFAPGALRVGYVPGVTVSKWVRRWGERFPDSPLDVLEVPQADQEAVLRDGRVDMCFVRLPIEREGLHAIPLYRELPVVVVPKDHPISLFDEVASADLADERMQDASDIDALAGTVELVAAVGGAAVMPHSLARLHHRRDLVFRTVTDLPETEIALVWPVEQTTETVEEFVGIVRGRTERSSRSPSNRAKAVAAEYKSRSKQQAGSKQDGSNRKASQQQAGSKGQAGDASPRKRMSGGRGTAGHRNAKRGKPTRRRGR